MSKTKQWAWDTAEAKVDSILDSLKKGIYTKEYAKAEIMKVDNLDLLDINEYNVDEVIELELEAA